MASSCSGLLGVVMIVPVMAMIVVMPVMIVVVLAVIVVHVTRLAVGRIEELRLQFDDAVEVEAPTAEDGLQRDVGLHRPVDGRQGIDAPDARFHGLELGLADEVGLDSA